MRMLTRFCSSEHALVCLQTAFESTSSCGTVHTIASGRRGSRSFVLLRIHIVLTDDEMFYFDGARRLKQEKKVI